MTTTAHDPLRWGVLGTGRITTSFMAGARRSDEAVVVAVGSRTKARADAFAVEHSTERAHGSYDSLLADPAVEAVYISLPNSLHHPWTMRALQAGKHVLCEKPYTRHPAEVGEAFDLADRSGLVLSEAFMWRHHEQAKTIVRLLPEIGPLQTIRASFSFIPANTSDVRLAADMAGGSLMDVGCYCVSGARLLAGEEPDLAIGWQADGPGGVDIKFSGILHFPSGVVAEISSGFTTERRGLEAIGSAGSIALTDPWNSRPAAIVRDGVASEFPVQDAYQLEIDDVSRAVRSGSAPLLGRADALGQARVIEALYRSAATGAAVRL